MVANTRLAAYDLTKPAEEIVVALINNDNGTTLKPGAFTFGQPKELTTPGHNSQVKISAAPRSGYSGSKLITYNRINLADVPDGQSTDFDLTTATRVADIIPTFNERFGVYLRQGDYIDGPLPVSTDLIPNEELSFDVVADQQSLIYYNQVSLRIKRDGVSLKKLIRKVVLSGLQYTPPAQRH